jgi:hypothetical protein
MKTGKKQRGFRHKLFHAPCCVAIFAMVISILLIGNLLFPARDNLFSNFSMSSTNLSGTLVGHASNPEEPDKPTMRPPTFIMRRDTCTNLYHVIIWHMVAFINAAAESDVRITGSQLIFTDECSAGLTLDLYLLLGFKQIDQMSATTAPSDFFCDLNQSSARGWKLVNTSCLFVHHVPAYAIEGGHMWPRTESELRKHASALYSVRRILRETFCAHAADRTSEIIFIDRNAGSRGLLNQEEVIVKLSSTQRNVSVVQLETLTLGEQADMFCNVGVIVGVHGAGFTWLLVASASASVIEIFPYGWADPCYRNIARVSGLSYFAIQNTNKGNHDESCGGCGGRFGYTRLDVNLLDAPLSAALLVSSNAGNHFSPPCKDLTILQVPVPADYPCEYNFVRDTPERVVVERMEANTKSYPRIS